MYNKDPYFQYVLVYNMNELLYIVLNINISGQVGK